MKVHHLLLCAVTCSKIATAAPPETQAVEFFNASLGHYFVTADAAEAVGIDAGGAGSGWARTGRHFGAWLNASNAPAGSAAVCRFYSSGANSHFFTANAAECASLKTLESAQRQDAIQSSRAFTGWTFEGIAFTAVAPSGAAACASGTEKIFRAYNDGFASGEGANHRFVNDLSLRELMIDRGWIGEGVAFCAPVQDSGTSALAAASSGSFPELVATWSGQSKWEFEPLPSGAKSETRVPLSVAIDIAGHVAGSGNGCTLSGALAQVDGFRAFYTGTIAVSACPDVRFIGSHALRIERLSSGQIQMHFGRKTASADTEVEASLASSSTPPVVIPPASGSTMWAGTVAWIAVQKSSGAQTVIASVNQPLSLTLSGTALTGSGFGCTFTGTAQTGASGVITAALAATGCQVADFNGTYTQVELHREDGLALEVEFEKETQSGQTTKKATIRGVLNGQSGTGSTTGTGTGSGSGSGSGSGTTPQGFVLPGTWGANGVEWTATTRQGGNPEQTIAGAHSLSLTISTSNGVTGSGFGCAFTGSVAQPAASKLEFVASLQAAGCTNPAFDGAYANARLQANDGALEIEVEREVEAKGMKTKVRIEGTLRK